MIRKLFLDHPASVGETYGEHAVFAVSVGWTMFVGSLACFVHALVPALFPTTGSTTIMSLHEKLTTARQRASARSQ